ncbi:MAG: hypothetical protein ChlgKO_07250 [Chlamydiales bacterium]
MIDPRKILDPQSIRNNLHNSHIEKKRRSRENKLFDESVVGNASNVETQLSPRT